MNPQITIDFPILATSLFMYFGMKGIYKILCHFCPSPNSTWHSGYIAGHNALAEELRPKIDNIVENWEKIKASGDTAHHSPTTNSSAVNDCKIPRQEQNL